MRFKLTGRQLRSALRCILSMFSMGRNRRTWSSTPRNAFMPSNSWRAETQTLSFLLVKPFRYLPHQQFSAVYLHWVMQGGAGRVQRQVLEGFDPRRLPAVLLRPVDGQHVVGELLAEQQRGRVGLRLAFCAPLDAEVRRLRRTDGPQRKERGRAESRAGRRYSDCFQIG